MCSFDSIINITAFPISTGVINQEVEVLTDNERTGYSNFAFSFSAIGQNFITHVKNLTAGSHTIQFRYKLFASGGATIVSSGVTLTRIYIYGAYK
jgi:hypothetical protein